MADVTLPTLEGRLMPVRAERERLARELSTLIDGEVRFGDHDRMLYATDASIYQVPPIGVVVPANLDDVQAVVRFAAERNLPLLPRGGGTSLAGQVINAALVIDFSAHCNGIIDIDEAASCAWVEPGVVLDDLNAALAPRGLMFGPDVATSTHANLGGMIGNNSAGARSVLYGRTVEHVQALDVLLADGCRLRLEAGAAERDPVIAALTRRVADIVLAIQAQVDDRFPKIIRHVDGYNLDLILQQLRASAPETFDRVNLASLFCGSEGTLGLTLAAKVGLVDKPARRALAIVAYPNLDAALHDVGDILTTGPSAVEVIDDTVLNLANDNAGCRPYLRFLPRADDQLPGAVLYVEYGGGDEDALNACRERLDTTTGAALTTWHTDPIAMAGAWTLRKSGEPLLTGMTGRRKPQTFVEDLAVDPARLPQFIREFRAIIEKHDTSAAYFAHASVGCLHIRPFIDLRDAEDVERMKSIADEATELVIAHGGALSGEHGDGRLRSHLLDRFYGPEICRAFSDIKAIFDPEHRLNPGNIVAPQAIDENLRVRPGKTVIDAPDIATYFHYERERGLGPALDLCNGAGMCRKTTGGTMCPSYRATREERHSTRGRGNALRLAMTGQMLPDQRGPDLNDEETLATLDLCLSCKACKSECPSNVDVARLKAEYLAQSYDKSGRTPWRARLVGGIRRTMALASAFHRLSTFVLRRDVVRTLVSHAMQFDPRRSLPPVGPSLYQWFDQREEEGEERSGPAVILFPDCFTVFGEPHIGRAAVLVLERLGYQVVLPRLGCCGRSSISVGMLRQACETITRTATALNDAIDEHDAVAVVGCEPSCMSALRDDWPDLRLDVDRKVVQRIANLALPVEEFVGRRWATHPNPMTDAPPPEAIPHLFHGHCHHKAVFGQDGAVKALSACLGEGLTTLDSGCCGMAGSFGYGRDHYELSMRIFEQSLDGALRETPDAVVLAGGTSCRQQIHHATGRVAIHPIERLATALELQTPAGDTLEA